MRTFVAHLEPMCGGETATGRFKRKIELVCQRFLWYHGNDTVILPSRPDPEFLRYVSIFKLLPTVFVPSGLDPEVLDLPKALRGDPRSREHLSAEIDYYISSTRLYKLAEEMGGHYLGGEPCAEGIALANDKEYVGNMVRDHVGVPHGVVVAGLEAVSEAVTTRLVNGQSTFVRATRASGGLGNRRFDAADWVGRKVVTEVASAVREQLLAYNPDLWLSNPRALVEEVVPLKHSPGVAFHTERGLLYDFMQLTQRGDFCGFRSPVPDSVVDHARLAQIGQLLTKQLTEIGFYGDADSDLGVATDGRLTFFEVNGRKDGVRHHIEIGELLHGPWKNWRKLGVHTLAYDDFFLRETWTFRGLLEAISRGGIKLASPRDPWGVVLSIPPQDGLCGLQIFGQSWTEVEERREELIEAIGAPGKNWEDHPVQF